MTHLSKQKRIKIILFIAAFLLAPLASLLQPSVAIAHTPTLSTDGTGITLDELDADTYRIFNDPDGVRITTWNVAGNYGPGTFTASGDGHFYILKTDPSLCSTSLTYNQCKASLTVHFDAQFWKKDGVYYLSDPDAVPPPPPAPPEIVITHDPIYPEPVGLHIQTVLTVFFTLAFGMFLYWSVRMYQYLRS